MEQHHDSMKARQNNGHRILNISLTLRRNESKTIYLKSRPTLLFIFFNVLTGKTDNGFKRKSCALSHRDAEIVIDHRIDAFS